MDHPRFSEDLIINAGFRDYSEYSFYNNRLPDFLRILYSEMGKKELQGTPDNVTALDDLQLIDFALYGIDEESTPQAIVDLVRKTKAFFTTESLDLPKQNQVTMLEEEVLDNIPPIELTEMESYYLGKIDFYDPDFNPHRSGIPERLHTIIVNTHRNLSITSEGWQWEALRLLYIESLRIELELKVESGDISEAAIRETLDKFIQDHDQPVQNREEALRFNRELVAYLKGQDLPIPENY